MAKKEKSKQKKSSNKRRRKPENREYYTFLKIRGKTRKCKVIIKDGKRRIQLLDNLREERKKYLDEQITMAEAKKIFESRPKRARTMDLKHTSKYVLDHPTRRWALYPGKYDVKGIDTYLHAPKQKTKSTEITKKESNKKRQFYFKKGATYSLILDGKEIPEFKSIISNKDFNIENNEMKLSYDKETNYWFFMIMGYNKIGAFFVRISDNELKQNAKTFDSLTPSTSFIEYELTKVVKPKKESLFTLSISFSSPKSPPFFFECFNYNRGKRITTDMIEWISPNKKGYIKVDLDHQLFTTMIKRVFNMRALTNTSIGEIEILLRKQKPEFILYYSLYNHLRKNAIMVNQTEEALILIPHANVIFPNAKKKEIPFMTIISGKILGSFLESLGRVFRNKIQLLFKKEQYPSIIAFGNRQFYAIAPRIYEGTKNTNDKQENIKLLKLAEEDFQNTYHFIKDSAELNLIKLFSKFIRTEKSKTQTDLVPFMSVVLYPDGTLLFTNPNREDLYLKTNLKTRFKSIAEIFYFELENLSKFLFKYMNDKFFNKTFPDISILSKLKHTPALKINSFISVQHHEDLYLRDLGYSSTYKDDLDEKNHILTFNLQSALKRKEFIDKVKGIKSKELFLSLRIRQMNVEWIEFLEPIGKSWINLRNIVKITKKGHIFTQNQKYVLERLGIKNNEEKVITCLFNSKHIKNIFSQSPPIDFIDIYYAPHKDTRFIFLVLRYNPIHSPTQSYIILHPIRVFIENVNK